ncbi:unnamed protein product [Linum tenue]|uniref:RNase H type-1 domain-containing protein n=1 Tax=Linum tenue TaxID=586396 RepID=A0AAV0HKT3_9ROSI|nr:unnamed protein product [Linum tenue]
MAQCLAIGWGIDLAMENGFGSCEVESDCLGVVQKLQKEETTLSKEE